MLRNGLPKKNSLSTSEQSGQDCVADVEVDLFAPAVIEDATGTVVSIVKTTPGAVSYAVFAGTRNVPGLVEVSLDGVAPNDDNVIVGKYPFWSYEHMYTNGPPNKEVSRFLAFVQSRRDLLNKLGYIPMSSMKVTESDR